MKKIDIGQTLGIMANLGVIAGIVFLAAELHQNNEALGVEARLQREQVYRDSWVRVLSNQQLISAQLKARTGEPLTAEDEYILTLQNRAIFTDHLQIVQQVLDGLLEEDTIPLLAWRFAFHGDTPRLRETWDQYRPTFPPDFVAWYEDNVVMAAPPE